jgi:hypothetical protein
LLARRSRQPSRSSRPTLCAMLSRRKAAGEHASVVRRPSCGMMPNWTEPLSTPKCHKWLQQHRCTRSRRRGMARRMSRLRRRVIRWQDRHHSTTAHTLCTPGMLTRRFAS